MIYINQREMNCLKIDENQQELRQFVKENVIENEYNKFNQILKILYIYK